MSRRSSRLQAKQQPQPSQTESPQEAQIIQAKKRKTTQFTNGLFYFPGCQKKKRGGHQETSV
ncbi:CCNE2 isoform 8 [Pan troglodytes]|uniref:Cyclin E2 n=2 Tax=Homininae TaxID=207598 RepID=E5RHN2_HUMAN|nr:cyclin E2 [Homo sapiens]KAI4011387.1 cyclin E2 [Homo sapiens]PNI85059.1 CCNE2 isoform 8 [Pan troglodytes]